jgi:dCMP deaminase
MSDLLKFHTFCLDHCKSSAKSSTCLRRRFGAIIVDPDFKDIVGEGYNGSPRGTEECTVKEWCLRQDLNIAPGSNYEICCSVHAEQNAIIYAGKHARGKHLYLYGEESNGVPMAAPLPCFLCTKMIINAGIIKVFTWSGSCFIEINIQNLYEKYIQEIVQS